MMFDVIWTDHNRESVGARRARKELEREKGSKTKQDGGAPNTRSSVDTRGSTSSSEKPFGFLGSMRFKRSGSSLKSKATASSALRMPKETIEAPRDSLFTGPPSTASTDDKPNSMLPLDGKYLLEHMEDDWENSPSASSQGFLESVFTKWTEPSLPSPASPVEGSVTDSIPTPTPKTKLVQALGPDSYITKTSETSVEARKQADVGCTMSGVTITASAQRPRTPSPPVTPRPMTAINKTQEWISNLSDGLQSPTISSPENQNRVTSSGLSPVPESDIPPAIPPRSKRRIAKSAKGQGKFQFKPNNPELWRAPEVWGCTPASPAEPASMEEMMGRAASTCERNPMSLNLASMQREVKRMAAASPSIILRRLNEEWGLVVDAALYKELEMEKKRWMLSALHNMDVQSRTDQSRGTWSLGLAKKQKILTLYESQTTASYLAAVHPKQAVYHLSPSPLSHSLFPNVIPMLAPVISSSAMPFGPDLFAAVHALTLPAIIPGSEIPVMLRSIGRYLAPHGALHLMVIDPSPISTTLGPHMSAWLSEYLLLNLERQFRCTNPSKLLPAWLDDARLRAEGSTITTTTFEACLPEHRPRPDEQPHQQQQDENGDGGSQASNCGRENDDEQRVRVELRSTVGRMLWQEVWGGFVTAPKWWWEDVECAAECRRLGTKWQYSTIRAVKQP